jgi:hypothetical protein
VIVEDELDRGCLRIGGVELSQEGDEPARTVSFLDAGVDHGFIPSTGRGAQEQGQGEARGQTKRGARIARLLCYWSSD